VSSGHAVVAMAAGDAPVLCLREVGRPELPSSLEVVWNSSVECSIMARSDGDPLRVVPMKTAHESLPLGERLKLMKQSAMNSWLPKKMISAREKPPHVRHSPSVVTPSVDE
jgi:hypothetical protein